MDETEKIRVNAQMFVQQFRPLSGINFGYNKASVHWLQSYIERIRADKNFESQKAKLTNVFGSFLGECIVRCYGGQWGKHSDSFGVIFDQDNVAFPFSKVQKQLDNGLDHGIANFFDAIEILFNKPYKSETLRQKPWWKVW